MNVSKRLGRWYDINKRILPWRERLNPYHIWLSEIILQQTRVNQGMQYYLKFIEKFPDIETLASSSIEEILILWQGLGYYARARNLHKAAGIIAKQHNGIFPSDYDSIRELPGIGDYTAAAIASLAFNKPYPAIDGNVFRVLSRYFGIFAPVNASRSKSDFYKAALEIFDSEDPGRHNQAMIELGALICLPRNPICGECPISGACYAYQQKKTKELPVKLRQIQISDRYFYYLVIEYNHKLYLQQRIQNDIWAMLYEFPLIETKEAIGISDLLESDKWKEIFQSSKPVLKKVSGEYIYKLSHQRLHVWFIEVVIYKKLSIHAVRATETELEQYPFPRLVQRYLAERE